MALLPAPAWSAPQTVRFKTRDGWKITAAYRAPGKGRDVAILIHGAASGKEEWDRFADKLEKLGIGSLALDLRGHGQSREGPRGHEDFNGLDAAGAWPSAANDIESALSYLRRRGIPSSRVGLAGASIGANLASQAASRESVAWLLLFSPGLDYRGVGVATSVKTERILLAASPPDVYAAQSVLALKPAFKSGLILQASSGHGAQMFADEAFLEAVIHWLRRPRA